MSHIPVEFSVNLCVQHVTYKTTILLIEFRSILNKKWEFAPYSFGISVNLHIQHITYKTVILLIVFYGYETLTFALKRIIGCRCDIWGSYCGENGLCSLGLQEPTRPYSITVQKTIISIGWGSPRICGRDNIWTLGEEVLGQCKKLNNEFYNLSFSNIIKVIKFRCISLTVAVHSEVWVLTY